MATYPLDVVRTKLGINLGLLGKHPDTQDDSYVFSKTITEKYKCTSCKVTIEVVFERDVENRQLIGCTTVNEFWQNHENAKCKKNYVEQLRTRARYQASQRDRGVLTRQEIVQLQLSVQQLDALEAALEHRDRSMDVCLEQIRDLNEELYTAQDNLEQLRIQRDQYRSQLSEETDNNQQLSEELDGMQLVQDELIDKIEEQNTKIKELREKYKSALLELETAVDSTPTVSVDDVSKTIKEMLDRHDKDGGEVKEEEDEEYEEEEQEQAEMKPAGDQKVIKKEDV